MEVQILSTAPCRKFKRMSLTKKGHPFFIYARECKHNRKKGGEFKDKRSRLFWTCGNENRLYLHKPNLFSVVEHELKASVCYKKSCFA